MTVTWLAVTGEKAQVAADSNRYWTAPGTAVHVKSSLFPATVAPLDGATSDGAAARSVNVRAVDHGPARLSASLRRTRHAYAPVGSEVVGAHAENFVVALRTLFAGENSVSPFLYTSTRYVAA
jgi:hypothetical protein